MNDQILWKQSIPSNWTVIAPPRSGDTYENTYGGWLRWLETLALSKTRQIVSVPRSWAPFLRYIGHDVVEELAWFPEDLFLHNRATDAAINLEVRRRLVEVASACRPELVHALYLWDTDWRYKVLGQVSEDRPLPTELADGRTCINVTCNGSFFRPEFVNYQKLLEDFEMPHVKIAVLVPCAADKPYPAPIHRAVSETCPGVYQIVSTGVLGVVPEGLWMFAPNYDAGLPNFERVYSRTLTFFMKAGPRIQNLIVYLDFNAFWVNKALTDCLGCPEEVRYPLGNSLFPSTVYEDLMSKENLAKLRMAYQQCL